MQNRRNQPNSQIRMSSSGIKKVKDDTWDEMDPTLRRLNPVIGKKERKKFPLTLFSNKDVTDVFLSMLDHVED